MKLFRFDAEVGRSVALFDSQNVVMSAIVGTNKQARIGCVHLGPKGEIGYHEAPVPQLFLVVDGAGWVRGDGGARAKLSPGQAAFFSKGEWHGAGTDGDGLVAIVVESEALDPDAFMPQLGVFNRWNDAKRSPIEGGAEGDESESTPNTE